MKPSIIPFLVVVMALGVGRAQAAGYGENHYHNDPYANVTSGMLLGVYAQADGYGLEVTGLIPGYSAVGRLQPGDVLLRMSDDGYRVFNLTSMAVMEQAKAAVGPNRDAAVEFYRPGVGLTYAWVTFTPIAGPAFAPTATRQFSAQFRLESEKPGCRAMFDRIPRKQPLPGSWTVPNKPGHVSHPSGPIRIQPYPYPIQTNNPGDHFPDRRPDHNNHWNDRNWDNNKYDPRFTTPHPSAPRPAVPRLTSPSDLFGRR